LHHSVGQEIICLYPLAIIVSLSSVHFSETSEMGVYSEKNSYNAIMKTQT